MSIIARRRPRKTSKILLDPTTLLEPLLALNPTKCFNSFFMESLRTFISSIHYRPQFSWGNVVSSSLSAFFVAMHILQAVAPKKSPFFRLFHPLPDASIKYFRLSLEAKKQKYNLSPEEIDRIIAEVKENQTTLATKIMKWNRKIGLHHTPELFLSKKDPIEGSFRGSHGKHCSSIISLRFEWLSPTFAQKKGIPSAIEPKQYGAQRKFVILKNLAHIRQNSVWKQTVLDIANYVFTPFLFFPGLLSIVTPIEIIVLIATSVFSPILNGSLNKKADLKAWNWKPNVKEGAKTLLEWEKQKNRRKLTKASNLITRTWKKFWLCPDGSERWSYYSLNSRLKRLSGKSQNG